MRSARTTLRPGQRTTKWATVAATSRQAATYRNHSPPTLPHPNIPAPVHETRAHTHTHTHRSKPGRTETASNHEACEAPIPCPPRGRKMPGSPPILDAYSTVALTHSLPSFPSLPSPTYLGQSKRPSVDLPFPAAIIFSSPRSLDIPLWE